jgi:hypothetical protein
VLDKSQLINQSRRGSRPRQRPRSLEPTNPAADLEEAASCEPDLCRLLLIRGSASPRLLKSGRRNEGARWCSLSSENQVVWGYNVVCESRKKTSPYTFGSIAEFKIR